MRRALTLVEILVTLAVVALLIGLLVPALSSARSAGRSLTCQSNLRQMLFAGEAYAARSDGWYPVAVRYENGDGVFETIAWDWRQNAEGDVEPGSLWSRDLDPADVQQCPSCLKDSTFGLDPFTGYNYNTTYIAGEATFPQTGWQSVRRGTPVARWRRASEIAVFGDGGWKGGANKFMRAPTNDVENDLGTVYAGGQAFRHRAGTTNVCYGDGHIEATGDASEGEHATDQLLSEVMGYPSNGFLSNDDAAYDPR